ncbi:T9SS type A sorting domain-containing protein, partial [bacterium]|nr:T9SS type A sorting domain-containing protein [bacterium]
AFGSEIVMQIKRLILIISLPLLLFSNQLTVSDPIPVCGTPHTWGKIPEIVIIKRLAKPTAGDTTFYIREDLHSSTATMIEVSFYKIKEENEIVVYAEAAEVDSGRIKDTDTDRLVTALLYETPASSINPNKGIIANEIEIFGQIPDVDKNGKLFVLLIDVRDNYVPDESETYVAGYFDPLDQINQPGKGNYGDIIYIDTNPAKVYDEATLGVIAHELQHLIHYGADSDESIWLNEGLSEFASIILGFESRSFSLFLRDTNRPLNSFDDSVTDYAKVGLWTFYNYKRFGVAFIHDIVQEKSNSLDSYGNVLQSNGFITTKEELMQDWFIANLINNPDIFGGKYSYKGENIPDVQSDHFYGSFTNDNTISVKLSNAAAQYIQFYAGKDIEFNLDFDTDPQFKMAIIRHSDEEQVNVTSLTKSPYNFEDPDFGITYKKITFIPFWEKITSKESTISLAYSASGIGGVEESEIVYDESVSYYIQMNDAFAAEKFQLPDESSQLAGIMVNVGKDSPLIIQVLQSLNGAPVEAYEIIPNQMSWTKFYFPNGVSSLTTTSFYISVSSEDSKQSLGYCETHEGFGRAYLKTGSNYLDLNKYQVGNESLDGDWAIAAIIRKEITSSPMLSVTPAILLFWSGEYTKTFEIRNLGSEELDWQITSQTPVWMTVNPTDGSNLTIRQSVSVTVNRNLLDPGIFNHNLEIQSNGGNDSLMVSILERNRNLPQSAIYPDDMIFSDQVTKKTLRVINIGIGEAGFNFQSDDPALAFYPVQGVVGLTNTARIDVFIDPENIYSASIPFTFYNGIDSLTMNFQYQGTITGPSDQLKIFSVIPNPFLTSDRQTVDIRIRLIDDSKASLKVYNILGQEIDDFTISEPYKGLHVLRWAGKNSRGNRISSGVYFLVLQQKNKLSKQKLLLLN